MAQHNKLGKEGEDAAAAFLERKGFSILSRNWRKGRYELDIIAEKGDELVIVEVKTRSEDFCESPEEAVNTKKIRHIVSAADLYIKLFRIDKEPRFDIITVVGKFPPFEIEHIEDAFFPPLNTYR